MHHRILQWSLFIALAGVMGLTAGLYARSDMAIWLAEQLWACF